MKTENIEMQTHIISDSWNTYICSCADIGIRWLWDPFWQIKKIDSNWSKTFPQNEKWVPSEEFIFTPNDVLTYTYSYN
jgi:hypothetical protein